jgi:hypothetical protein
MPEKDVGILVVGEDLSKLSKKILILLQLYENTADLLF